MGTESATRLAAKPALVRTRNLSKRYEQRGPFSRKKFVVDALVDVDFEIIPQCFTAVVGGSGSGKSTLASCLTMLERPDRGEIWFEGQNITELTDQELASFRAKVQMVFQDSAGALNPRFSAAEIIAEPLVVQQRKSWKDGRARARDLMEEVGVSPDWADRRPLQFSGGQRQRLAIARAIALKPALLILDESLSGLDLATQAQILNLLLDLERSRGLTCLLISHDLSLVGEIADFVAVMHDGRVIEHGPARKILDNPGHLYTRQLMGHVNIQDAKFDAVQAGGQR